MTSTRCFKPANSPTLDASCTRVAHPASRQQSRSLLTARVAPGSATVTHGDDKKTPESWWIEVQRKASWRWVYHGQRDIRTFDYIPSSHSITAKEQCSNSLWTLDSELCGRFHSAGRRKPEPRFDRFSPCIANVTSHDIRRRSEQSLGIS